MTLLTVLASVLFFGVASWLILALVLLADRRKKEDLNDD